MEKECPKHGMFSDTIAIDPVFLERIEGLFAGRDVPMTPDKRRDAQGRPPQLTFYAVNKRGEYGSASMFPATYAVCDEANGARVLDCASLYQASR